MSNTIGCDCTGCVNHDGTCRRNYTVDSRYRFPISCAKCQTPIRKYLTGAETPCRDCDGSLCERCCEAAKTRANDAKEKRNE